MSFHSHCVLIWGQVHVVNLVAELFHHYSEFNKHLIRFPRLVRHDRHIRMFAKQLLANATRMHMYNYTYVYCEYQLPKMSFLNSLSSHIQN